MLLPAFIGSLSVAFIPSQKHGSRQEDEDVFVFGKHRVDRAIRMQGAAEGVYFFENFPRMLKAKNDEYHKEFNAWAIDEGRARGRRHSR